MSERKNEIYPLKPSPSRRSSLKIYQLYYITLELCYIIFWNVINFVSNRPVIHQPVYTYMYTYLSIKEKEVNYFLLLRVSNFLPLPLARRPKNAQYIHDLFQPIVKLIPPIASAHKGSAISSALDAVPRQPGHCTRNPFARVCNFTWVYTRARACASVCTYVHTCYRGGGRERDQCIWLYGCPVGKYTLGRARRQQKLLVSLLCREPLRWTGGLRFVSERIVNGIPLRYRKGVVSWSILTLSGQWQSDTRVFDNEVSTVRLVIRPATP